MAHEFTGTVTRKSNGTIEFQPSGSGAFPKGPAMGDEVKVTVEVTRTAAEIEKANVTAKAARAAAPAVHRVDVQVDGKTIASTPIEAERPAKKK